MLLQGQPGPTNNNQPQEKEEFASAIKIIKIVLRNVSSSTVHLPSTSKSSNGEPVPCRLLQAGMYLPRYSHSLFGGTLNHKIVVLSAALGCLIPGAVRSEAATITSFSAAYSYAVGSGFTSTSPTVLNTATTATVTGTSITCLGSVVSAAASVSAFASTPAASGCSGRVLDFTLAVSNLLLASPFAVTIDGTVNGSTVATGQVSTNFFAPSAFNFGPGAFNTTIFSSTLPPVGSASVTGFLSLSLAAGQTVSLPSSLAFSVATPSTIPEPGSVALLASGLGGFLFLVRRRSIRS